MTAFDQNDSIWGPYGNEITGLDQVQWGTANSLTQLESIGDTASGGGMSSGGGMIDGKGFAGLIQPMMQLFQGNSMLNDGIDVIKDGAQYKAGLYRQAGSTAVDGANYQAAVYRQSGQSALNIANYNVAIDQFQTRRADGEIARELSHTLSTNFAGAGSTGISIASKSTLAVQNDVLTTAERQTMELFNDSKQRQAVIRYEGELTNMQYENQARASEYSGQVQATEYENQARSAIYEGDVEAWKQQTESDMNQQNAMIGMVGKVAGMAFGGF